MDLSQRWLHFNQTLGIAIKKGKHVLSYRVDLLEGTKVAEPGIDHYLAGMVEK